MTVLSRERAPGGGRLVGRATRQGALPSGRAVTGAFLVAVAVVLVASAWLSATGTHGRPWVVAARDLPAGAQLSAGDLATETMTLPAGGVGARAYPSPTPLLGEVLASPLRAGELVQASDVAAAAGGTVLRPVTVGVRASDLTNLADGTLVDVLVTDGTDPSSPTTVVVAGAHVLGLARGSSSLVTGTSGAEVTLGVTTLAEVTAVVHAEQTGTLSVVVGAPGDTAAPGGGGGASASSGGTPAGGTPVGGTSVGGASVGGGSGTTAAGG